MYSDATNDALFSSSSSSSSVTWLMIDVNLNMTIRASRTFW